MFKDEYLLDYINLEDIDAVDDEDVDERVVENTIARNVKRFMMTFGKDFAYVGNQYNLEVFGEEQRNDLLFFNRQLNCLVAIELKAGKFKTAYLGQLYGYLQVLDDQVRKPHENPSIGIILCRHARGIPRCPSRRRRAQETPVAVSIIPSLPSVPSTDGRFLH